MKIYVSCDIEGVNGIATWSETEATHRDHAYFANVMTREVENLCKGLNANGEVSQIYVKDAHDSGRNIDHSKLAENVVLNRSWAKDPLCMVHGVDGGFDAAIFTGYHSAGMEYGNSLAHTMSTGYNYIKVNGEYASEFLLNYYCSLHHGVPVVMVTGDRALCDYVNKLDENIVTVATKDNVGGCTISQHPEVSNKEIFKATKKSLENIGKTKMELPKEFDCEICFKKVEMANRASFYPKAFRISANSVGFRTDNIIEFMTFLLFI